MTAQYVLERFDILIDKTLPKCTKNELLILQSLGAARLDRSRSRLKSANRNIVQGELSLF